MMHMFYLYRQKLLYEKCFRRNQHYYLMLGGNLETNESVRTYHKQVSRLTFRATGR
jgi:hypothetical protein